MIIMVRPILFDRQVRYNQSGMLTQEAYGRCHRTVTGLLRHDSTAGMTNIVTNKSYSCQEKYLRIVGHFNII